jgi:hypothetical protein
MTGAGRGFYVAVAVVAVVVVLGVVVVAAIGGDQSSSTIGQLLGFGGLLLAAVRISGSLTDTKTTLEATAEKVDEVHANLNGKLTDAIASGVLKALDTRYPAQWGPPSSPPRA